MNWMKIEKLHFFNHTPVLPSQPLIPKWTDFAFWKNCNLFATENSSKSAQLQNPIEMTA